MTRVNAPAESTCYQGILENTVFALPQARELAEESAMFADLKLHLNRLDAKHKLVERQDWGDSTRSNLKFFTRMCTRLLDAERCSIFILDPETKTVWLRAGTGLEEHGIEVSTEGSIVGEVIETGQPRMLSGLEHTEGAHRETDHKTGFVTKNVLCVPIPGTGIDETVGAIEVLNKNGADAFTEDDADLLEDIAQQIRTRVSQVYLAQEIFGLSEKVAEQSQRVLTFLFLSVAGVFLVVFAILLVWVLMSLFS